MIYSSCRVHLKHLTDNQIKSLQTLSAALTTLYNLSLSAVMAIHKQTGSVPTLKVVTNQLRHTSGYKAVGGIHYPTILAAISSYQGYLSTQTYTAGRRKQLLKLKNLANLQPPHPRQGLSPIPLNCTFVRDSTVAIPKTQLTPAVVLTLPQEYAHLTLISFCIRHLHDYQQWEIVLNYTKPQKNTRLDPTKYLGIDLGVSNFATCATNDGQGFIVDGRQLKGIIQGYCKYRKKLRPHKDTYSKRFTSLRNRSKNKIQDYINKSVALVIKYCVDNDIGNVRLGWGLHFQTYNLGNNTQLYHFFPFAAFADALQHKCREYKISFSRVDECFTSLASFIDADPMPATITRIPQHFSGKRRYRGLYRSKEKIPINADFNAALNILRKCNAIGDSDVAAICSRGLAQPQRISPLKM